MKYERVKGAFINEEQKRDRERDASSVNGASEREHEDDSFAID